MAIGAIVALLHDLVLTAGIYSLVGFEVTPVDGHRPADHPRLLALRHRRRVRQGRREHARASPAAPASTYSEAANLAVNQTLMRSINTSVIALLPVAGLLFVGAGLLGVGTLKDLALVLFVGLAAGTYSSIFLATPIAGRPQGARAGAAGAAQAGARPAGRRGRGSAGGTRRRAAAARRGGGHRDRAEARRGRPPWPSATRLPDSAEADVASSRRRRCGRAGRGADRRRRRRAPGRSVRAAPRPGGPTAEAAGAEAGRRAAARRADRELAGRRPDFPEPGVALPGPDAGLRRRRASFRRT